jgi:hypothetical protein
MVEIRKDYCVNIFPSGNNFSCTFYNVRLVQIEFISLASMSIIPTAAMIDLNCRFTRSPTALTSPHAMALSAASSSPPFTRPALISCARPYALVQPPLLRTTYLHLCFQTGLNSVCEGLSFAPV